MSDNEQADFENLIKSPGWQRVCEYATAQWTHGIAQHISAAVNDRDDSIALQKMRQVIAAKSAVEQLIAFPDERLRLFASKAATTAIPKTHSRRGGL